MEESVVNKAKIILDLTLSRSFFRKVEIRVGNKTWNIKYKNIMKVYSLKHILMEMTTDKVR